MKIFRRSLSAVIPIVEIHYFKTLGSFFERMEFEEVLQPRRI